MREHYPHKQAGDTLGNDLVNQWSAACRRTSNGVGSYGTGYSGSFQSTAGLSPFIQHIVRIQSDEGDGIYKVRVRYYEESTNSWATSTEEYTLDANEVGTSYTEGEKLVAFFHAGREAFIPLTSSSTLILRAGVAAVPIPVGESGTITIWEKPSFSAAIEETEIQINNVWHDWITGGVDIAQGDQLIIGWFGNEGVWRIIGAACPT